MCRVLLNGHNYEYEVRDILRNFCNPAKIEFVYERVLADCQSLFVESSLWEDAAVVRLYCVIGYRDKRVEQSNIFKRKEWDHIEKRKYYKRMVKHNILIAAEKFFEKTLPWGILSGIRPVKIVHGMLDRHCSMQDIKRELVDFYRLVPSKADLIIDIALRERKYIMSYEGKEVGLYISIPFCPTRCSYCSFPSNEISAWGHMADDYLKSLTKEMQAVYRKLTDMGYVCQTVYVGGGTPTSLNSRQIEFLLNRLNKYFVSNHTLEFTVEAGRPDTLDPQKLKLIKDMGVTRIAINPQSMNMITLKRIGRNHTPQDVERAFTFARDAGHDNINMDIIVGLPGEDVNMVINTLEAVSNLNPEGVTVHTLAIKRASRLNNEVKKADWVSEKDVEKMLQLASKYGENMGMKPYYLYRQKYMLGNLENVGYCLPGRECIYNMQIMEEKQTIIGMGAGAVSKLVYSEEDRLERLANIKDLHYYINRIDQVIEKKITGIESLKG